LAGLAAGLFTFVVAEGAGAGIAQVDKRVVRAVAVGPLDVYTGSGGQVYFYGFGVSGGHVSILHFVIPNEARSAEEESAVPGRLHRRRRQKADSSSLRFSE
jgi:hypothetical protein